MAQTPVGARLQDFAEEVGSRKDLLLVKPEPQDEQGLRATVRHW